MNLKHIKHHSQIPTLRLAYKKIKSHEARETHSPVNHESLGKTKTQTKGQRKYAHVSQKSVNGKAPVF